MFKLEFSTDNDAFVDQEATETCALLRDVIRRLKEGELDGNIRDSNGNIVGQYKLD